VWLRSTALCLAYTRPWVQPTTPLKKKNSKILKIKERLRIIPHWKWGIIPHWRRRLKSRNRMGRWLNSTVLSYYARGSGFDPQNTHTHTLSLSLSQRQLAPMTKTTCDSEWDLFALQELLRQPLTLEWSLRLRWWQHSNANFLVLTTQPCYVRECSLFV
jgi:hypothetical protein